MIVSNISVIMAEGSGDIPLNDIVTSQPKASSNVEDTSFADNRPGDPKDRPRLTRLGPLENAQQLRIKQKIRVKDVCGACCGCEVTNICNHFILCKTGVVYCARQVSSMIPSTRPTVPLAAITIFHLKFVLLNEILKVGDGRTYTCENIDHYWPCLWVGQVEQILVLIIHEANPRHGLHYFNGWCLSGRENLVKQLSIENSIGSCGSGRADHWWHACLVLHSIYFCLFFQAEKKFSVEGPEGDVLYWAREKSDCCDRFIFANVRPLRISIEDQTGAEVLNFRRPLNCAGCCCWFCYPKCTQKITVNMGDQAIGK